MHVLGQPALLQQDNAAARIVPAVHNHDVLVVGDAMAVVLRGEDTGGVFSLVHSITAPEAGPPLHVHHREDETFYILKGEYDFSVGGKLTRVGPGDTVFGARGVPHAYRNAGQTSGEMLVYITPSGFERFFERVGELAAQGLMNPELLTGEAAQYGCTILGPPLGA